MKIYSDFAKPRISTHQMMWFGEFVVHFSDVKHRFVGFFLIFPVPLALQFVLRYDSILFMIALKT